MSNTRKAPGDPNAGLVELSLEPGAVIVQLFPPGRSPVELRLPAQAAADLGAALIEGAAELQSQEGTPDDAAQPERP